MAWRHKESGHQQPWYWLCWAGIIRSPHVQVYRMTVILHTTFWMTFLCFDSYFTITVSYNSVVPNMHQRWFSFLTYYVYIYYCIFIKHALSRTLSFKILIAPFDETTHMMATKPSQTCSLLLGVVVCSYSECERWGAYIYTYVHTYRHIILSKYNHIQEHHTYICRERRASGSKPLYK